MTFLRANIDVFAWQPSQMPGIRTEVIEHHLKIYPDARPVQQRPRKQSVEQQNFICEGSRPSFHQKSPWALCVSRHTMKPRRTSSGIKISTWSTSEDGKLLLKMHATSRRYHQWFVRSRELQVDDLVLNRVLRWEGMNKLFPY
jgi:hypothetical protein